jgi:hypothetical protein
VRTFHLEPEFFVQGDTDGVSKHENAADSLPCSYRRRKRRAAGVGESLASAEDTFAHWRGYTVTYPRKYKQLRATFSRPTLRGVHATFRGSEGVAKVHRILPSLLSRRTAQYLNAFGCVEWCRGTRRLLLER